MENLINLIHWGTEVYNSPLWKDIGVIIGWCSVLSAMIPANFQNGFLQHLRELLGLFALNVGHAAPKK